MDKAHHALQLSVSLLIALSSLTGCGGGGGGGGSSPPPSPPPAPPPVSTSGFTVSVASINQAASVAGDEPTSATFQIAVADPAAHQFGIGVRYTNRGIVTVTRDDEFPMLIEIFVSFFATHEIDPGTYQDTIRVGDCADVGCTAFRGDAITIPVTYTVTVGTLPTITVASSAVQMSRLPWDTFTPPEARVKVTPSARTRFFLAASTTHSSDAITSAVYSQLTGDSGDIVIAFKPGAQLTPGVHTDTINVKACIEPACRYPLVVNPSVITVTYNVSGTVPGPQGFTVRQPAQPIADVAWSAARNVLYATIPTSSASYPGRVVELDPVTDAVVTSVAAGFDPMLLALSDDGSRLYVSERGGDSIRRFSTAPLTADILISLGTDPSPPGTDELIAADLRVAPGQSQTLAVRRNNPAPDSNGRGIVIFDNAVQRPAVAQISSSSDWGFIAWDPDGTRLYTNRAQLSVGAAGPVFQLNLQGSNGRLRVLNGRIYSDEAQIIDPAAPDVYTRFETLGQGRAAVIDAAANRIYFATQYPGGEALSNIEVFNLTTRALIGRALLPPTAVTYSVGRLVRVGSDAVAFVNPANQLFIVQGPLIQ